MLQSTDEESGVLVFDPYKGRFITAVDLSTSRGGQRLPQPCGFEYSNSDFSGNAMTDGRAQLFTLCLECYSDYVVSL